MTRTLIGINNSSECANFRNIKGVILRYTTYGCELDVFDNSTLNDVLKNLKESSIVFSSSDEQLDRIKRNFDDKSLINYAFSLLNQERYWEYHEILEKIWRKYDGNTKEYIQCLIHIGVSMVKLQLEQTETASIVYNRTMEKMKSLFSNDEFQIFPQQFHYPIRLDETQVEIIMKSKIMKNII